MSKGHTDAEMLIATQVAYLNIEPGGHPENVGDWMSRQKAFYERIAQTGPLDPSSQAQLDTINHLYDMLGRDEFSGIDLYSWNVVDSRNHNTCGGLSETGMYASLISTGDGEAIIGFRGSESYDTAQAVHDWGEADLGLHNRYETFQQKDAENYMEYLYGKYSDEYELFDVTGHSLGGNLAEHATINAPGGMRDRINRCISFDGPGFSEEYIAGHALQIAGMSGKVDHYAWSAVGGLLFPLPGSHYMIVDAKTPSGHGTAGDQFFRHDTANVRIVDGHVVPGERDPMAIALSGISKQIELIDLPFIPLSVKGVMVIGIVAGGFIASTLDWLYHEVTDASAEFSTDTTALYQTADMLESTASLLRQTAEEVRTVTDSIEFFSPSAMVCRIKLKNTVRAIEGDSTAANNLSSALRDCASEYISSDEYAASHLAV